MCDFGVYCRRLVSFFMTCSLVLLVACAKQQQTEEQALSFDVLAEKSRMLIDQKKNSEAIRVLSTLIERYPEHKDVSDYRLRLADLFYNRGEYEQADKQYRKYKEVNPSRGEYASYHSILCKFNQTFTIDRDPTPLQKTIQRCKKHLDHPIYGAGETAHDVKDILYTAQRKVIDREIHTFDTYLDLNKTSSAEQRLRDIEKQASAHQDLQPRLFLLKTKLALSKEDVEGAQHHVNHLAKHYPSSLYTDMAQRLLKKHQTVSLMPASFFF